jgi:CRP-like cAMP-binding protein
MNVEQRAAVLGEADLFQSLDGNSLLNLGERATDREYEAGRLLYEKGASADELYVLASGSVAILVDRGDGREDIVSTRRPTEAFGEAALYDREGTRMVSARAVDDCAVVLVPAEDFRQVVRTNPDVAEALLRLMASVIRNSTER